VSEPELSVVVPSHERPLRLRWLLNALEEQTLDRSLWEVIVCHDSSGPETETMLAAHPLAADGTLQWVTVKGGTVSAGRKRNLAIERGRGATIVFTDDDCRPPAGWLECVLAAVRRHPGAIIQGAVEPDPDESAMLRSPYPHTQILRDVPRVWAECCNIAYPRSVVERLAGFAEDMYSGEDTDLNRRARAAGTPYLGDERMLTYHAVEERWLIDALRGVGRWIDVVRLLKRHPMVRRELPLGIFWKRSHLWLAVALLGLGASRRRRHWVVLALAVPWALEHRGRGAGLRGHIRELLELPGWAVIDLAEMLTLARGSVRDRTLLL
jgi:GT2 family glycosyltransferase